MKNAKIWICLFLVLCLCLALFACKKDPQEEPDDPTPAGETVIGKKGSVHHTESTEGASIPQANQQPGDNETVRYE